ncbi:MAG TPA: galactokinase [Bryobacterales bacterium]|nr:galactokinase [Bryobacterales bacterium]
MIITRTPFRITLGGGGTDLPAYYSRHGGFIFAAGLNKYMFVYLNTPIVDDLVRVKYSETEIVEDAGQVRHTLAREALRLFQIRNGVEIISMADVPAGTGLGSSSCYLVGLLNGLHTLCRKPAARQELAEEACRIELDILHKPIGKQDQYMATFGGLTVLEIDRQGRVEVGDAEIPPDVADELQNNILLFYTGLSRSTEDILAAQVRRLEREEEQVTDNLHLIQEIGREILAQLRRGNVRRFGELLDEHWRAKKELGSNIAGRRIDSLYDLARANGAIGGKISGAGGGGFFLFYAEEGKKQLRAAMEAEGLREMRFRFDLEGSKVLVDLLSGEQYHSLQARRKPAVAVE